jgi:hypothetical protein
METLQPVKKSLSSGNSIAVASAELFEVKDHCGRRARIDGWI